MSPLPSIGVRYWRLLFSAKSKTVLKNLVKSAKQRLLNRKLQEMELILVEISSLLEKIQWNTERDVVSVARF